MKKSLANFIIVRRYYKRKLRKIKISLQHHFDGRDSTISDSRFKGLLTVKDIATVNMDQLDTHILADAKTSYKNIVDTLDATILVRDIEGKTVEDSIVIGTNSPEPMEKAVSEGDIVISWASN